jgi:hypothetical protein
MRKIFVFMFVAVCCATSCTSGEEKINQLDWMNGTWEGIDANGLVFVEVWTKGSGTWMDGKGATLTPEGDTMFREILKIELVEGTPYYVATVPENPGPVLFKMVEADETHCVFENTDHDFPQRIEYTLETKSTMSVQLQGIEKGLPKTESLSFEKNTGVSLLPGMKSDSIIWQMVQDSISANDTTTQENSTPEIKIEVH